MLMRIQFKLAAMAVAIVAASFLAFAGGFVLEIGKPSANPEAQAARAVLQVRAVACVSQEKTSVTATAIGIVNGRREGIPLKLIPLSDPGTYAVTRQWPAQGTWFVIASASNPRMGWQPSAVIKVENDSVDWAGITRFAHAPTEQEIAQALNATVTAKLVRQ
jgi:hypothetical protein